MGRRSRRGLRDCVGALSCAEEHIVETHAAQRSRVAPAACAIVSFDPKYREDFARLNYAWIEKYFAVESLDRRILDHPEDEVIATGGAIFFAVVDGTAVGTVALKREGADCYELTKMAVDESRRGTGCGRRLLEAAIDHARKQNAKRIVLSSHSSLIAAINMYRSAGFIERSSAQSCYSRCNIYMQKDLEGDVR
jgi:GNAT superfamily N-acetyltransferase